MSTLREHLHGVHQTESENWKALGTHFDALRQHLGKALADKGGEALEAIAAACHAHSEFHAAQADKCSKATEAELEKHARELVPTSISGVVPTNENFRRGITPVARHGQPDPNTNRPRVQPEFEKVFESEDTPDLTVS